MNRKTTLCSLGPVALLAMNLLSAAVNPLGMDDLDSPQSAFPQLNQLVREALEANPEIQAARRAWQASTKRPPQEGALPNPELSIGSMTDPNPIPFSTIGDGPLSWASFMFFQTVPWPGKRRLKEGIAEAEAARMAQEYRRVVLEVVARLKEAYFDAYYSARSLAVLDKYNQLLGQVAKVAETRYAVGEGQQQEVLRSQVEISIVIERTEMLRLEKEVTESRLSALLGRSPESPVQLSFSEELPLVSLPLSLQELYLQARDENPEMEERRLAIQQASLQIGLSRKNLRPDFKVGFGYLLRGGPFPNMYQYELGLEIPLYFWRKERLEVEQRVEEMEKSRADYHTRLQGLTSEMKQAHLELSTARRLLDLYRKGIVPQSAASLDASLAGYQVGRLDFGTLLGDYLTLLNYELQYELVYRDFYRGVVSLEQRLGRVLIH